MTTADAATAIKRHFAIKRFFDAATDAVLKLYQEAGEPYGAGQEAAWRWFDERVEAERPAGRMPGWEG